MSHEDPGVSEVLLREEDLTPEHWIRFLKEATERVVENLDTMPLGTLNKFGCFKSTYVHTDHACLEDFESWTKKKLTWTPEKVSVKGLFRRCEKKNKRIASAWIIGLTKNKWQEFEVEFSSFEKADEFSLIVGIKSRAVCLEDILEEYDNPRWDVWHLLLDAVKNAAGHYAHLYQEAADLNARFQAEEKILYHFLRRRD